MPCCVKPTPVRTHWLQPDRSEVQHQTLAFTARHANHHDLVAGLFGGAQHHVPVIGCAFQHTGFARPTNAFFTAEGHVDFQCQQLFVQGRVCRDFKSFLALAQLDSELLTRIVCSLEDHKRSNGCCPGGCVGSARLSSQGGRQLRCRNAIAPDRPALTGGQ
jgi:hypothetical protein